MTIPLIYVAIVCVMSLITFAAYGIDKRQAKRDGRRISEARLHWLALLGGWPGAFAGQQFLRHKTRKIGFQLIFWAIVASHVAMIVAYAILSIR